MTEKKIVWLPNRPEDQKLWDLVQAGDKAAIKLAAQGEWAETRDGMFFIWPPPTKDVRATIETLKIEKKEK